MKLWNFIPFSKAASPEQLKAARLQAGKDFVASELKKGTSLQELWNLSDDPVDRNDFEVGMQEALREHEKHHP